MQLRQVSTVVMMAERRLLGKVDFTINPSIYLIGCWAQYFRQACLWDGHAQYQWQ